MPENPYSGIWPFLEIHTLKFSLPGRYFLYYSGYKFRNPMEQYDFSHKQIIIGGKPSHGELKHGESSHGKEWG